MVAFLENRCIHYHTSLRDIEMAVSKEFQNALDRLTQLITADRSNIAVTVADAVRKQADADQAAIQAANDAAAGDAADKAALAQANQDLTDQIAALNAKIDELSAPAS